MCLIITQPKGHTLPRAHLLDIFARNADGFGIMWSDRGTLRTFRAVPQTADEMLAAYQKHAAGRQCVLHWRQATHGTIDTVNAHPFLLTRDVAVVHNGMLDCGTPTAGKSDTWHLARHVLAPIARANPEQLFSQEFAVVLGGLIGKSNKLVFQHADGRVAIVNEHSGVTHERRWYSNTYAWAAPHALLPQRTAAAARAVSWLDDDWRDLRITSRGDNATAWERPSWTDCDPLDLLADCVAADDTDGIADWCAEFPETAAEQLAQLHGIATDDARHYVTSDRPSVVESFRLLL